VVGFVAGQLAGLIKGHVGPAATRALSRAIADRGLRMLSLEAEAEGEHSMALGAEALVATLEDTVRAIAELPAESIAEPLRLEAEIQEAFADGVARHLPRSWVRDDIPGHETDGEAGVWVFMPRSTGRRYRYRKYTRVFPVSISRPLAQAVLLRNGDTLERRLLDAGLRRWPVTGEVHLYETLPGTHLGHLAAGEAGGASAEATSALAGEFEDLTSEAAALLVGSPKLGRPTPGGARKTQPAGRRLYRLKVRGVPPRRRMARFVAHLDTGGPHPQLRVHFRLSEREAHGLAGLLARRAHSQVVATLRRRLDRISRERLAYLIRTVLLVPGWPKVSPEQAATMASVVTERMLVTAARQLPTMAPKLADAIRDPAAGVTLTFTFTFTGPLAIHSSDAPIVVRPGHHRV
jgi:hypothetical protein